MLWADHAVHLFTVKSRSMFHCSGQLWERCNRTWGRGRCPSVAAGAFLSPCESEKAWKMGIVERVGPVVMVNTAQLWRLESGIDSALGSFLSLVWRDQQRDSLIVQLRHDGTDSSHSLAAASSSPATAMEFDFCSIWTSETACRGKESNSYSLIFQPP